MEGRGIRLEKGGGGGEQGDFSILPDFRTCPLFLTISTPGEGNQPLSLTKPPSSLPGAAVPPQQWRGTDLPRGAEVKIPAALTFCPSASGRMKNTPFLSPGTLQGTSIPSPWPSSPSLPPLHLILLPPLPHLQTFSSPKKNQTHKLLGEGEKGENHSLRGAEQQALAVAERGEPASPRPQPALQHCWPKASVTSPVKQRLEQRGSWGLKCLFLADRRLCWISTVYAPNGNLSLSLSSLSGVCLAGLFSFKKASLLL